jgi:hypothetical protein
MLISRAVKDSWKVNNGKRAAEGQDVFSTARGLSCLERKTHNGKQDEKGRLVTLSYQLRNSKLVIV